MNCGLLAAALAALVVPVAMAEAPLDAAARQLDKHLRGCWTIYEAGKSGTDYRSLCFVDNGLVETAEISGAPGAGLNGVSDGGGYAIVDGRVSFIAESGDFGWMWDWAGATCTATFPDATYLDLTACGQGAGDLHFERRSAE